MHTPKTNALRILESMGIVYESLPYEVGEEHQDAVAIALQLSIDPDCTYKTLVTQDEKNRVAVFCLPSNAELNLKKAAKAALAKRIELINLNDLLPLTGYVRGGCSPIGMKKRYPVFIEETSQLFARMSINAGMRGLLIRLAPNDLARACEARFADVI
jgi:Cys-tRNA(Pro)/Cys-tRNA(Cys) deacylase